MLRVAERMALVDGVSAVRRALASLTTVLETESDLPLYRHYKSQPGHIDGLYEIVCEGAMEATGVGVVVYRSLADDRVWVRPVMEFYGSVETAPGARKQRFTRATGVDIALVGEKDK